MAIFIYSCFLITTILTIKTSTVKYDSKRDQSIDIAKAIATVCVISVHQIVDIGYFNQNYNRVPTIIASVLFEIVVTGVPLFLVISGFLLYGKIGTKKYYLNLVFFWMQALSALLLSRIFLSALDKDLSIFTKSLPYYIPLYSVLYLIAPILNFIIDRFTKKSLTVVLFVFLLLYGLPDLLLLKWNFLFLSIYKQLARWTYPILYYCIGAYIRKYDVKLSTRKALILFLVTLITTVVSKYSILLNKNPSYIFGYYNGIPTVLIAVLIFLLCRKIKFTNLRIIRIFQLISIQSLNFYLLANIGVRIVNISIASFPFSMKLIFLALSIVLIMFISYPAILTSNFIYKKIRDSIDRILLN